MTDSDHPDQHDADMADTIPAGGNPTIRMPAAARSFPKKIGPYALKQVLATGGMGTVYIAIQEHPRRTVALKVMKKGIVSTSTLRRFEFESQVLARLRHPNIAQIYDAGTFDDGEGGVPYFAMEYIPNAKPFADYVRSKHLKADEVIPIFLKVCDAVNHGHQKGVIHRDLKPDNILVDSKGEPKVIDFGVARSTESDLAVTTLQTDVGQLVGTLQYMSPEQCDADPHDLDVRSDVYALGVVLYELLCGTLPYDVSQVAIFEAARLVKESRPARLSTIDRTLRGDLETITLKALEKDRDRRYQSTTDLALDLERYLHNEPILARAPTLTYQVRMFARRNRAACAAIMATAVFLVIATVVSVMFGVSAVRSGREARAAERAAITQRDLAVEARAEAQTAKEESDRQRDVARAARAVAETQSYIVNVASAAAALEGESIASAKRRLSRAPAHLRSWEWRFLSNLADQSIVTLSESEDWITSVAFSPNGLWVVSGSTGGAIRAFNPDTGQESVQFRGHDSPVYAVACSPRGQYVASASADMTVRIWNLLTGDELATLEGHEGVVTSLAYRADGGVLVSGSSDASLRVWDPLTGEELHRIEIGDASVDCVAISPDGTRIVSGSDDGLLRFWDAATAEPISTLDVEGGFINALQFSVDGSMIASASEDGVVRVWGTKDEAMIARMDGHAGFVSDVAFGPDGRYLVSGSEDGTLRIWDVPSGIHRITLHGHDNFVRSVAVSPDGRRIVSGSEDLTIRLWDACVFDQVEAPAGAAVGSRPASVGAVAFVAGGARLVGGRVDGTVSFWESLTGEWLGTIDAHAEPIRSIAVSGDGAVMATASDDATIRLWDAATARPIGTLTGHERRVTSVAFRADDTQLVSGSWDGVIRVWDLPSLSEQAAWSISGGSINAIALAVDGAEVACASSTGEIVVLDLATGAAIARFSGHEGPVTSVGYSADGTRIISGSADATIRIWDATGAGAPALVLRGHAMGVSALAFTPDGSRIISGSLDRTMRIWSVETGDEIAALPWQHVGIECIAVSAGGERIATGRVDGTIIVRDALERLRRFQQRADAQIVAGSARRLVDGHRRDGMTDDELVAHVSAEGSLSEPLRQAALSLILRDGLREQGSASK